MKIAVAIMKPEKMSPLAQVFGRSNYFLINKTSDNSEIILQNPFANELGGAGIQSARFLIENEVDIVIVKKIGMNPYRFLTSANIKVYQSSDTTGVNAIQLFTEGKLNLIGNTNSDVSSVRKRKRYGEKIIKNKKGNS